MRKIAIIGANEFQNPLILKAQAMGFETHVFAWEVGDIGEHTADYFYPISIVEKDEILKKCQEIGVDTVVSVGSDLAALTVNYIARAMGLPCNDAATDLISTNKFCMREAFVRGGIPTPRHLEATIGQELREVEEFTFPIIVKPTDRSGSRGINQLDSTEGLEEAVAVACGQSFAGKAIVEEYIDGPEYSCECINWEGNHKILAFTKKYTTGAPHFIETGHDQPADIPEELMPSVTAAMYAALDALNIRWGAAHIEFRINPQGEVYLIEVGSRMGGDCIGSDLVMISTGYDFLRMVIDVSMGKEPDFTPVKKPEKAAVRFVLDETSKTEYEKLSIIHPEQIWRKCVEAGDCTSDVVDSSTRFGYYILHY